MSDNDPLPGWPRWRFINYWKLIAVFLAARWRLSNFWKPGIVEDFWSFCLFNFYVSGQFIGITILNFSLEYKRQHPAKSDPALPVQPGVWRVAYTPPKPLDLDSLKPGDVVQNLGTGNSFVILEKLNGQWLAVRSLFVTNPSEWEKIEDQVRDSC